MRFRYPDKRKLSCSPTRAPLKWANGLSQVKPRQRIQPSNSWHYHHCPWASLDYHRTVVAQLQKRNPVERGVIFSGQPMRGPTTRRSFWSRHLSQKEFGVATFECQFCESSSCVRLAQNVRPYLLPREKWSPDYGAASDAA